MWPRLPPLLLLLLLLLCCCAQPALSVHSFSILDVCFSFKVEKPHFFCVQPNARAFIQLRRTNMTIVFNELNCEFTHSSMLFFFLHFISVYRASGSTSIFITFLCLWSLLLCVYTQVYLRYIETEFFQYICSENNNKYYYLCLWTIEKDSSEQWIKVVVKVDIHVARAWVSSFWIISYNTEINVRGKKTDDSFFHSFSIFLFVSYNLQNHTDLGIHLGLVFSLVGSN